MHSMIVTIRPHGSININLVKWVERGRKGRFNLIDDCGNRWGIEETTFEKLKERGIEEVNRK